MRRLLQLIALPCIALTASGDDQWSSVVGSAQGFLSSLDRDQHRRAVMSFEDDYRTLWRYTPVSRQGVSWNDLDKDQATKAQAFIKSFLSEFGYKRSEDVRTLEHVLSQIENSARRDRGAYFLTFFGAPSEKGKWGWRYEGHHLSLNFTVQDGKLISSTPQFFGANPADVPSGEHKGMRMLAMEEDLGIAFLASLTVEQRKAAIIAERAPNEIFTAENRTAAKQGEQGIRYSGLSAHQKRALKNLVRVNAESQSAAEVKRRMDAIDKGGWDNVVFAWMGAPDRSDAHYYRIQGPTFLIEFDNTQNRANHIHLVWREFDGDFGRDVLKDHYDSHAGDLVHGHDD